MADSKQIMDRSEAALGKFLRAVSMARKAQDDGFPEIADQYWVEAGAFCSELGDEELTRPD
jgi:hypothetical protein